MGDMAAMAHQALHQQVSQRLRQRIIEGHLAPGAKLNERELSEQLQVSRTPLREAIRMLAAEGLVTLLPHRGAVVPRMSPQAVADTFELIAGLEGLSGELAAQRITAAQLVELRARHFEMRAAHARRDLPAYYRHNAAIHDAINAAAGNAVLTDTFRQVNARLQALRFRSNFDERKWDLAVQEHEQMVDLLARRNGPALRRLMEQHVRHKAQAVLELMQAGALQAAPEAQA
jgi:DNA-binding GntR family transcriptional regulator